MAGSVKDEISENEKLSEFQALYYFVQATEGIVYLHNMKPKPIIHRDIKSKLIYTILFKSLFINSFM